MGKCIMEPRKKGSGGGRGGGYLCRIAAQSISFAVMVCPGAALNCVAVESVIDSRSSEFGVSVLSRDTSLLCLVILGVLETCVISGFYLCSVIFISFQD